MDKLNEAYDATLDSEDDAKSENQSGRRRSSKTESNSTSGQTDESGVAVSRLTTTSDGDKENRDSASQFKKNITYVNINADNKEPAAASTIDMKTPFASDDTIGSSNSSFKSEEPEGESHFTISWHNLDYVVESNWYKLSSQRKLILSDLSGTIKTGELTAILGPSGAGKSTLIDCLLGKRTEGLRGKTRVTFRDSRLEQERRRKRPLKIATIPQEDHLLDTLTVMETFMFASKIKNAHLTYEEEEEEDFLENRAQSYDNLKKSPQKKALKKRIPFNHLANVQRVIQQLSLSSCAALKCGKLSGGQYKRVSIGQELLSRPDIMILDEPTSGLDSVTCFQTVNALRKLIDSSPYPMAIVSTIHQPDVDVFSLFHKAYVLASSGRAIYEGPTTGIFDQVQLALELVEARQVQAATTSFSDKSKQVDSDQTGNLRHQLNERRANPARLIVELAANEYGYEITKVLNEMQRRDHRESSSLSSSSSSSGSQASSPLAIEIAPAGGSRDVDICRSSTSSLATATTCEAPQAPAFDYNLHDPTRRRADLDKLLHLVSANMNQRRSVKVYVKHLFYHFHRSWITILRDPMLFSVQVALHVFIPLLISYAFQGRVSEACPSVGPLDVIDEAYRSGNILDDLNKELRSVFENLGYMFFQIYVIIFAAVCMTSLTYPLAMHVLLKEYRNGWYSMSSYFLGRTLADLPVPTFNVIMAIAISYHLTGQPLSPYAWRFLSVAMLTVLATLVAQTQGLMFGAMLMNAPQAAVFVAPASTAPLVVVSGFLIRIQSLPWVLQFLSYFSYFTHLLNGFIISRYGFHRCPCKESDFFMDESRQVPLQARTIIDIWVETFKDEYPEVQGLNGSENVNLVGKLVDTITRAKMFNHEMKTCDDVKPFTMLDYQLNDADLLICFLALIAMLIFYRWLTYIVLTWKIRSSI